MVVVVVIVGESHIYGGFLFGKEDVNESRVVLVAVIVGGSHIHRQGFLISQEDVNEQGGGGGGEVSYLGKKTLTRAGCCWWR
ncbi:hypothetical protein CBR_g48296 [Chara braunii]|uniref:Uncharacterized protein n=1 Tax=Chara braunii TaxID=69332 RepID=A0A388K439_CHABU|nr:hypothetical protein CBR_g48296 [Chara braunii]|eukprot:GBG64828.1 hypothetical protein CBR_g48296 [Chara braunii]